MAGVTGRPSSKWTGQTEKFKLMFHNCPSLAAAAREKELCCARSCLSLGEREEDRQQLPPATQPAGNRPTPHTQALPYCKCTFFLEKGMKKREECRRREAKGTGRGGGPQILP